MLIDAFGCPVLSCPVPHFMATMCVTQGGDFLHRFPRSHPTTYMGSDIGGIGDDFCETGKVYGLYFALL